MKALICELFHDGYYLEHEVKESGGVTVRSLTKHECATCGRAKRLRRGARVQR